MPPMRRGIHPYVNVAFRADPDMLRKIDEILADINSKHDGPPWTRADFIRASVQRAIQDYPSKNPFRLP
jgi:hypothetical protein